MTDKELGALRDSAHAAMDRGALAEASRHFDALLQRDPQADHEAGKHRQGISS